MQLKAKTTFKTLKPTYRKDSIKQTDFDRFTKALGVFLDQAEKASQSSESEEHHKGLLADFLKDAFYKESKNYVNTKKLKGNSEIDLAIFQGKSADSKVGVIIEAKEHSNTSEMITKDNLHGKAFYETIQYYLYEKIVNDNHEIKNIIITDSYQWFIFDATEYSKLFYDNSKLKKHFTQWQKGLTDSSSTKQMYEVIGEMVKQSGKSITGTYIPLQDYKKYIGKDSKEAQKKLSTLFKILSPRHLLKEETTNDSNSLNKDFYNELLHIIGLEEVKVKGKKLIQRKSKDKRELASLLENTIVKIDSRGTTNRLHNIHEYGNNKDEQLFSIGLELCITWVNRILFLKLLESQLISYHNGNKDYAFLHPDRIKEFDELETLFFEVLAIPTKDRTEYTVKDFPNIPYLNSSLFEPTELERTTVYISGLKDKLPLSKHPKTVLKKESKKEISTLEYLLRFLDAYDFGIEGKEEIQEDSKTLINASVLGLIFEKINGYKDGSFYTPSFITMYMCRESIRRAVTQKLNDALEWKCETFDDIYNYLEPSNYKSVNEIINSLTICDPAVGSGHFLVSALNEVISIKSELGILLDKHGKRLRGYSIEIDNDELIVTDEDGEFLQYGFTDKGNIKKDEQRLQETLFLEKKAIIENCLFGVDINPNSVKICRLRLWIELLKNAFYTEESNYKELETLPNIDINIKQGNSLISRFGLDEDLTTVFKKKKYNIESYKAAVNNYRQTKDKDAKNELTQYLKDIKEQFKTSVFSKDILKISKLRGKIQLLENPQDLFGGQKIDKALIKKEKAKLKKLEDQRNETEANKIYDNAFEWRFEFPEVLDSEGNYIGFDCVIGNPPYVSLQSNKQESEILSNLKYESFNKTGDLYVLFCERANQIIKLKGEVSFIIPNKWMSASYGEKLRNYFSENINPIKLIDFEKVFVFDEAIVFVCILEFSKTIFNNNFKAVKIVENKQLLNFHNISNEKYIKIEHISNKPWIIINPKVLSINTKIEDIGKRLSDWKGIGFYRGITTGANNIYIISEEKKNIICNEIKYDNIIKKVLRGRNIKRYNYKFNENYLMFIPWHFPLHNDPSIDGASNKAEQLLKKDYPNIYEYLKENKEILSARNQSETGVRYEWYALQRYGSSYYHLFEENKIVWLEISDKANYAYDDTKMYLTNSAYFLAGRSLKYLLALLNSKVCDFYFFQRTAIIAGGRKRYTKQYVEQNYIPDIGEEAQKPFIDLTDRILEAKKENPQADTTALENEIDQLVYQLYDLTPEEIQIIENSIT